MGGWFINRDFLFQGSVPAVNLIVPWESCDSSPQVYIRCPDCLSAPLQGTGSAKLNWEDWKRQNRDGGGLSRIPTPCPSSPIKHQVLHLRGDTEQRPFLGLDLDESHNFPLFLLPTPTPRASSTQRERFLKCMPSISQPLSVSALLF